MDAAAEAFLAAAQNEAALAAEKDQTSEDDRSSSLSEIEDLLDSPSGQLLPVQPAATGDNDSEAETERIDDSPDKSLAQRKLATSPSKLGHSIPMEDDMQADAFSDSAISSPLPSDEGSLNDELDDEDLAVDDTKDDSAVHQSAKKRKRSLLAGLELDDEINAQHRRKRTRSIKSDDDLSEESGDDDMQMRETRRKPKADVGGDGPERDDSDGSNEDDEGHQEDAAMADAVLDSSEMKVERRVSRRNTGEQGDLSRNQDMDKEVDAEGSEDDEIEEEVDDADAIARSEEEAAKRMAAMEALTALEKHFATLRDRLYDERIASINHELAQLASSKPTHPELLRQIECVEKYRDEKFDVEQKLLVYRVGALKRKSVAERSQIHSAYFQTIRDMRERHLERLSEHFYRIQRDRFKAENRMPDYTIPFAEKRSVQISQQTAYNKEVSILSGVAKYVGFPAAPDLPNAQQKELELDLEKMGISAAQTRLAKQARKAPTIANTFTASISQPAAEEQFLEQTPWANPQHPVHRHRLQMGRQPSNQSLSNESLTTPAHQQRTVDISAPTGSASTIVENVSAQVSSAINTPQDDQPEARNSGAAQPAYRVHSSSPFDTRRINTAVMSNHNLSRNSPQPQAAGSSPLAARASILGSPPRMGGSQVERIPRHDTASPSMMNRFPREQAPGIAAGAGMGRLGVR